MDKFREECGLIGIWNQQEAANLAYLGLYAQQHRGQEGAGVLACLSDGTARPRSAKFSIHKDLGLVAEVFSKFDFNSLPGRSAIGHVRYTTAGGNLLSNVQPFYAEVGVGKVGVAHNGNLINVEQLRLELIKDGSILNTTSDTELILHLIAKSQRKAGPAARMEAIMQALTRVKGAYSLIFLFDDRMVAVRDPAGLRPLVLGKLNGNLVVASETCAFDLIGAAFLREITPGEVLEISGESETRSYFPFPKCKEAPCIFEYVYFARPDSNVYGRNVYEVRKRLGQELAKEHSVEADMVIPVPDSGTSAAIGYSQASGVPLELGLIRNHYVGRTFIEPQQSIRDFGVKLKLNANPNILNRKKVIVVDDSIVRGTTSKKIVSILREAGAKEVHLRISSPPTKDPCYYGIDTPQKADLLASRLTLEEMAAFIGVDSLAFLSIEGLHSAVRNVTALGSNPGGFCDACFSGNYPLGTPANNGKKQREMF